MALAIIIILFAVGMFLVLHDDHDNSYTKSEKKPTRQRDWNPASQKPAVSQGNTPRPARFVEPEKKVLDFHFLDDIEYHAILPERTMSSFIAGLQGYCTKENLGGVVGYVMVDPVTGALEVHDTGDGLMGYLPMKDRAAYSTFNPDRVLCPFAGHIGLSTTGRYYADIRIVLPSTRAFVEDSLRGFLG